MVTDTKIPLLLSGLHPAVCFSIAPLSDPISAAWLFPGEGMILRIEEKRREEKRREGSNQWVEIFEVGFSRLLFPP